MTIREIQSRDIPQLILLDRACFAPSVAFDENEFSHVLSLRNSSGFLITDQDVLVGFIISAWNGDSAEVITIDVEPDYRRRGIGSRLLTLSEDHLRKNGVVYLFLHVDVENVSALCFYQKESFQTLERKIGYYPNGHDAYSMVKCIHERCC